MHAAHIVAVSRSSSGTIVGTISITDEVEKNNNMAGNVAADTAKDEEDPQRPANNGGSGGRSPPPKRGIIKNRSSSLRSAGSRRISVSRTSRVLLGKRLREATLLRRQRSNASEADDYDLDRSSHHSATFIAAMAQASAEAQDPPPPPQAGPARRSLSSIASEDQNALLRISSPPSSASDEKDEDTDDDSEDEDGADHLTDVDEENSNSSESDVERGGEEEEDPAGCGEAGRGEQQQQHIQETRTTRRCASGPLAPEPPTPPTAPPSLVGNSPSQSSSAKLRSCMIVPTQEDSLKRPSRKTTMQMGGITSSVTKQDDDLEDENGTDSTRSLTTSISTLEESSNRGLRKISTSVSEAEAPPVKPKKRVDFSTIEVREYPRTLGDNPAVTSGPPVTIEWEYNPVSRTVIEVDEYESTKPPPRAKYEIVVPRSVREEWLKGSGFSRMEISDTVKGVNRDKRRRHQTVRSINGGRDKLEETVERVGRGLGRVLLRKPSSKALYHDWLDQNKSGLEQTAALNEAERDAARRATWPAAMIRNTVNESSLSRKSSAPVEHAGDPTEQKENNDKSVEGETSSINVTGASDSSPSSTPKHIVAKESSGDIFQSLMAVADLGVPAG